MHIDLTINYENNTNSCWKGTKYNHGFLYFTRDNCLSSLKEACGEPRLLVKTTQFKISAARLKKLGLHLSKKLNELIYEMTCLSRPFNIHGKAGKSLLSDKSSRIPN